MNGTPTENLEIINVCGESSEQSVLAFEPIVTDEPEDVCEKDTQTVCDGAAAENVATKHVKIFPRMICGILAVTGIVSYGYLGYLGIERMKNGGFSEVIARSVYGGIITSVSPVTKDSEGVAPVTDEAEIPSSENLKILSENIGCDDPDAVFNETDYELEGNVISVSAVPKYDKEKTVLIIHTHGTEGYAAGADVSAGEDFRTNDPEQSVVKVGSAFAEILESKGIRTIHCTEMFDAESYVNAYSLSGEAVADYIREDPTVSYVIDIHRDAVIRENGAIVRSDNGGAQLMIVCGTDEMGADFSQWRENFAFGMAYQHKLYEKAPNLVRHMNLRSASFNQQLCDRYLLLEVGTCGNTLSEAVDSAKIAAKVFADMILSE